jgi:outer membrane protein
MCLRVTLCQPGIVVTRTPHWLEWIFAAYATWHPPGLPDSAAFAWVACAQVSQYVSIETNSRSFSLTKNCLFIPAIALGAALLAQAQTAAPSQTPPPTKVGTKVGIIHIQNAIISTKDGQKAAAELTTKFAPKKSDLEKKQSAIAQLQDQLRKGSNTMSDEAKQKLMREIDQTTKSLNRESEDAQAELDQEQNKVMQELGQRIMAVIIKYARDNGYAVILDVSSQQTPVLYASDGIDITQDIIALYDKNAPSASSANPATPPPAAAAKPAAAPPKR